MDFNPRMLKYVEIHGPLPCPLHMLDRMPADSFLGHGVKPGSIRVDSTISPLFLWSSEWCKAKGPNSLQSHRFCFIFWVLFLVVSAFINTPKAMWVWINTYKYTILTGMNIQLNQLFWCSPGVLLVLTHCHVWSPGSAHGPGRALIDSFCEKKRKRPAMAAMEPQFSGHMHGNF